MNQYAPFVRIFLRYGIGALLPLIGITAYTGFDLANDPDLVAGLSAIATMLVSLIGPYLVERSYMKARKSGGPT